MHKREDAKLIHTVEFFQGTVPDSISYTDLKQLLELKGYNTKTNDICNIGEDYNSDDKTLTITFKLVYCRIPSAMSEPYMKIILREKELQDGQCSGCGEGECRCDYGAGLNDR